LEDLGLGFRAVTAQPKDDHITQYTFIKLARVDASINVACAAKWISLCTRFDRTLGLIQVANLSLAVDVPKTK
jgi:hypothetical protein